MGFVWRRSLASMSVLAGVFVVIGGILVETTSVSWAVPLAIGLFLVLVQYVSGPWLVAWLIPAYEIDKLGTDRYSTDELLTQVVVRQAQAQAYRCPGSGSSTTACRTRSRSVGSSVTHVSTSLAVFSSG